LYKQLTEFQVEFVSIAEKIYFSVIVYEYNIKLIRVLALVSLST